MRNRQWWRVVSRRRFLPALLLLLLIGNTATATARTRLTKGWEEQRLSALHKQLVKSKPGALALPMLLELAALRGAVPPARLMRTLRATVRSWRGGAEQLLPAAVVLRSLARDVAAELQLDDQRRWLDLPGAVTAWSYLGPLSTAGGAAFDRSSPQLDEATVRRAVTAGRDGPIRWRRVPTELRGRLALSTVLQRPASAIAYVESWVRAPRDMSVRVALSCSGRCRLYGDGRLVGETRGPAGYDDGRMVTAQPVLTELALKAGWHVFRVKAQDENGALAIDLRLGALNGEPLVLEQRSSAVSTPSGLRVIRHLAVMPRVQAAARQGARAAIRAIAVVMQHRWSFPAMSALRQHMARWRAKETSAALAWALAAPAAGDVVARMRVIPPDTNPRRYVAWAAALLELGRPSEAHRLHQRFAASNGYRLADRSVRACVQRVDLWLQLGASSAALEQARRCRELWPVSPDALDEMARIYMARDHLDMATHMHERLFKMHVGSARRFLELLTAMCRRGPPAMVRMDFVGLLLARSAQHRRGWEILARAYFAAGQMRAGRLALDHLPRWQWRDTTFSLSSQIAAAMGQRKRALTDLRLALLAAPGREDYRARLRRLAPSDGFFERYRRDLLALARNATTHTRMETVLTQTVLRHDGARQALYESEVIAIGPKGPSKHAVELEVVPSQSTLTVLQAAVVKADGRVLRRVKRELHTLSEDWYGLYYDLEQLTLHFDGLQPGDKIVVETVTRDFAADPFGAVFGELMVLGRERKVRDVDIVLELPVKTPLHSVVWDPVSRRALDTQLQRMGRREQGERSFQVWRLRAGPFAAIAVQPAMPGATEVAPYLHASSFDSSAAVARWYAHLVRQALRGAATSPALRSLAETLRGATPTESVANVLQYASEQIRYVGLEFGIHSLRPHDALEVLSRRFGDCKDKATLIVALLRHLGIASQLALVRTADNGALSDSVASLGIFDHAIVWVPGQNVWLDATQRYHLASELPSMDAGALALRIALRKGEQQRGVQRLPFATSAQNTHVEQRQIQLSLDGSGQLTSETTSSGLLAARARARLYEGSTRVERLESQLAEQLPGARVSGVKVNFQAPGETVRVAFVAAVPAVLVGSGKTRSFLGYGGAQQLVDKLGGGERRVHDLLLPRAFTHEVTTTWLLPTGMVVARSPQAVEIDTPTLAFSSACAAQGRQLRCTYRFEARQPRIAAKDVAQWQTNLARVDAVLGAAVELRQADSGGAQ